MTHFSLVLRTCESITLSTSVRGGAQAQQKPHECDHECAMSGVQSARKESNKPITRPQVECAGASCGYYMPSGHKASVRVQDRMTLRPLTLTTTGPSSKRDAATRGHCYDGRCGLICKALSKSRAWSATVSPLL